MASLAATARRRRGAALAWALLAPVAAFAAPPVGHCRFDLDRLAFAGTAAAQAACLLRPVGPGGVLAAEPARLPSDLQRRLNHPVRIDTARLAR